MASVIDSALVENMSEEELKVLYLEKKKQLDQGSAIITIETVERDRDKECAAKEQALTEKEQALTEKEQALRRITELEQLLSAEKKRK